MALFTASKPQIATYLFCVCPFSIAFLVFLNSSVSFVITDLLGKDANVGNDVGSLGFADELLALLACPLWGLLSDRIGVKNVCFIGYIIVGLALFTFVQAKNVYPQLLLARLFFSVGGAAVSTMVTAVLPTMSYDSQNNFVDSQHQGQVTRHTHTASRVSEATITPTSYLNSISHSTGNTAHTIKTDNHSKIAGLVGMATGCGALIALAFFLPLPARFQRAGISPDSAVRYSYYIVGVFAFVIAIVCFFGLRGLSMEGFDGSHRTTSDRDDFGNLRLLSSENFYAHTRRLYIAFRLGFQRKDIFVGYIGGFVARASSVAISLFIPLLVNAAFLDSGLCDTTPSIDDPSGLPDIKRRCPRAYVLAAALTGVSQFVALVSAPAFGYWSSRVTNKAVPLMVSSVLAIVGYPLFALRFNPDDADKTARAISFIAVCMIGFAQIGAIVCSLAAISNGLVKRDQAPTLSAHSTDIEPIDSSERVPLLNPSPNADDMDFTHLKGSVAGVYSFYGGAAILILTKAGGALFDSTTTAAPFYMMAAFNSVLLVSLTALSLTGPRTRC